MVISDSLEAQLSCGYMAWLLWAAHRQQGHVAVGLTSCTGAVRYAGCSRCACEEGKGLRWTGLARRHAATNAV